MFFSYPTQAGNTAVASVSVDIQRIHDSECEQVAKKTTKKKAPKRSSATKTAAKVTAKKTTTKKTTVKKKATKKTTKAAKKTPAKKQAKTVEAVEVESGEVEVTVDRRASAEADRRQEDDRRQITAEVESERREVPERRSKVARRRQIDPTTCERDYSDDEIEFMHALDEYKRRAGRMFPTCSEILEVVRDLSYRRLTPEEIALLATLNPTTEDASEDEASDTTDSLEEDNDLSDSTPLFGQPIDSCTAPSPAVNDLATSAPLHDFEA